MPMNQLEKTIVANARAELAAVLNFYKDRKAKAQDNETQEEVDERIGHFHALHALLVFGHQANSGMSEEGMHALRAIEDELNTTNSTSGQSLDQSLDDRFILLLQVMQFKEGHGFWKKISDKTGISSKRLRQAYTRTQRPTSDMIEAISIHKPEYAYWMATGFTDKDNGHISPPVIKTTLEQQEWPDRKAGISPLINQLQARNNT